MVSENAWVLLPNMHMSEYGFLTNYPHFVADNMYENPFSINYQWGELIYFYLTVALVLFFIEPLNYLHSGNELGK